jgi:cbb3-type cytochrome oxidase subunit 3
MVSLGLLTFILFFPYFYFAYRGEEKKKAAAPAADKPQA